MRQIGVNVVYTGAVGIDGGDGWLFHHLLPSPPPTTSLKNDIIWF